MNDTGIDVEANQEYEFRAAGTWVDLLVRCDADGYPTPRWYPPQQWTASLRRMSEANWFALVGMIVNGAERNFSFVIGTSSRIVTPLAGRLVCFANDVPGFYWNNFGSLEVTLRRIA